MRVGRLARNVLVMAAAPWCVWAQGQVSVVLWNYAEAPRPVLDAAAEAARIVFLPARVDLHWRIGEGLSASRDEGSFDLFVMANPVGGQRGAELQRAGYALLNPVYPRAYAFLDAVENVSERTMRSEQQVLTCIFVHEIGHLLGLRHQDHGAMRAGLDAMQMDEVFRGRGFNPEEAATLQMAAARKGVKAPLR